MTPELALAFSVLVQLVGAVAMLAIHWQRTKDHDRRIAAVEAQKVDLRVFDVTVERLDGAVEHVGRRIDRVEARR